MTQTTDDRPQDERLLAALLGHYREKFLLFGRRILKVQTMEGDVVDFELNGPQRVLHRITEEVKSKRPLRLIALKARRMGFSTYFSGRYYHKTSWNRNRYATQVTHEPEATDALFKMVKRFYNLTPEWLRPETKYNNTKLLEFDTKEGSGLNSGFRVATAGKEDFGSGQLIHYCHLCMSPDTPVLVADGKEKLVRDVTNGDIVVTHNGNYGRVVAVTKKFAEDLPDSGRMVVVHPWLGEPVTLTTQHKIWTNMGWVEAGELDPKWHMVSMPIREIKDKIKSLPVAGRKSRFGPAYNGPDSFPLNMETGFSIGYYLAEGCLSATVGGADTKHRLAFTLHEDEDVFAQRACLPLRPYCKSDEKVKPRNGPKTKNYFMDSGVLANFIDEHFGSSDSKTIPDWVFDCGEEFCRGLVAGYLAGDGSKGIATSQNYESNALSATSIRESITYQVRDIVAALGYGWGSVRRTPGGVRYGRNCRASWTVYFNGECAKKLRDDIGIPSADLSMDSLSRQRYRIDRQNRKVWIKIKKITAGECAEVYDLAIDHADHSFRTPHFSVSNSEVSKWPKETTASLLTSILQCVPRTDQDSEVVYESTAKGIGGEFYLRFWAARFRYWVTGLDREITQIKEAANEPLSAEDMAVAAMVNESVNDSAPSTSLLTSVFLPWFLFEKYQVRPPSGFGDDLGASSGSQYGNEVKLREEYGLTLWQLYWRRLTIDNECNGSLDTLNQEYPANPTHAFLGSGRPVFDNVKLLRLKEAAPVPVARYECLTGIGQWLAKDDGRLHVWQEPRVGRHYIVSADVAEGLAKGDFSNADVIDHLTGEQVAQWHGKIDADQFGVLLIHLGRRYNNAWLGVERNNHGLTCVTVIVNEGYPNIYAEMVPEPPGKPRKRYGWLTSSATRPLIIDNLVKEVREGSHGIKSRGTLEEMMSFKIQDNGKMEADTGMHDDRVISYAIGKHLRQVIPLPQRRYKDGETSSSQLNRRNGGNSSTKRKVPKAGWT